MHAEVDAEPTQTRTQLTKEEFEIKLQEALKKKQIFYPIRPVRNECVEDADIWASQSAEDSD